MPYFKDKIVILGADHNGIELKEHVKKYLTQKGFYCIDIGPYPSETKVDYVDYANILGKIIDNQEAGWGVLMCGTGVGMSMAANRFYNVRAALVHNIDTAPKTREHNNANVLCLGAWTNSIDTNLAIVDAWFREPFGEGRHIPRVEKFSGNKREKVVFTNGVFDTLHPGHMHLLKFAKSLGEKLVVGINSDRATKLLKGPGRPVNNEKIRKEILETLNCIDEVVVFDEINTADIIAHVNPHVVVKGGEWSADEVRRRDKIPQHIEVKIYPLVPGHSTTEFYKKIQENGAALMYEKARYDTTIIHNKPMEEPNRGFAKLNRNV